MRAVSLQPAFPAGLPAAAKKTAHLTSCSVSRQYKEDEVGGISK